MPYTPATNVRGMKMVATTVSTFITSLVDWESALR